MKICFPVDVNEGMGSVVNGHFGTAKSFLIYDTEASAFEENHNPDRRHLHGNWQPLRALGGKVVDAVVVSGIGAGAFAGLNRAGLKVYRADGLTVARNLKNFREGFLEEITADDVCGGSAHGHRCGQDHGS